MRSPRRRRHTGRVECKDGWASERAKGAEGEIVMRPPRRRHVGGAAPLGESLKKLRCFFMYKET